MFIKKTIVRVNTLTDCWTCFMKLYESICCMSKCSRRGWKRIWCFQVYKNQKETLYIASCNLLLYFFEFFLFYFSFLDQKSLYKPHSKLHTLHWSLKFAERSQILAYLITCCWKKKQLSGVVFFFFIFIILVFFPLKKKLVFSLPYERRERKTNTCNTYLVKHGR